MTPGPAWTPTTATTHLRLWTDLTRHAQPGYIAAPASLLAFTAWQAGNGALANLALDRAEADDPGYSMALLLRDTLTAGAPPSLAVLPMTPEEVAASYDEAVAETRTSPGEHGSGATGRGPRQLTVAAATGACAPCRVPVAGPVVCTDLSASQPRPGAQPASRSAHSTRSRSFPERGRPPGTGFAGSSFFDRWKTSCPAGPASCPPGLLRLRVLPHRNTPQDQAPPPGPSPQGAHHGRHHHNPHPAHHLRRLRHPGSPRRHLLRRRSRPALHHHLHHPACQQSSPASSRPSRQGGRRRPC